MDGDGVPSTANVADSYSVVVINIIPAVIFIVVKVV